VVGGRRILGDGRRDPPACVAEDDEPEEQQHDRGGRPQTGEVAREVCVRGDEVLRHAEREPGDEGDRDRRESPEHGGGRRDQQQHRERARVEAQ
jgi:hypothetical protein